MAAETILPLRLIEIIRVSRRNKRDGANFLSTAHQHEHNQAWCDANGAVIIRQIDESDSVSGKTVEREGLQTAIKMIEKGEADGVIVAKVDRFSRDPGGGLNLINRIKDDKKWFVASKDGIEISPNGTKAENKIAEAMLTFLLVFARWQREYLLDGWEDVKHTQIMDRGIAAHAPFGMRKNVEYEADGRISGDRRLIPDPVEAPWVEKIFVNRAAGWSWAKIRDWLIAEGVPARKGRWGSNSVRQIVMNRTYLGEVRSGDDLVNVNAHEPLIGLDLWNRANRTETTPGRKDRSKPEEYLLKTYLRCSGCGVRMFGATNRRTNKAGKTFAHRYYRCRIDHGSHGRCPAPARVDAKKAEAIVTDWFKRRFLGRKLALATHATEHVSEAEQRLANAEAARDGFMSSDAAKRLLRLDLGAYDAALDDLLRDITQARQAVADARNEAMGVNLPVDLEELWDDLDVDDRRKWLGQGVGSVIVARGDAPISERMVIFSTDDPSAPTGLPTGGDFEGIKRIDLDDMPASARPKAA